MDDAEGKAFVDALVKPPIDRPRLFDVLELPPNQRGRVWCGQAERTHGEHDERRS